MDMRHCNFEIRKAVDQPKAVDAKSRVIRFVGSTESVARDGGILKMGGWQLDGYRANPVFLWSHQQDQPPIGRAVRVGTGPDGLEFDIEFAGDVYPFADLIGRLYEAGYMRAVSVGFRVLEERPPTGSERAAGAQWVATSQELLELSAVPVGADASALVAARGACRPEDAMLLRRMGPVFEGLAREIEAVPPTSVSQPPQQTVVQVIADVEMRGDGARPYTASGEKIKDPTPAQIAAYEEEKKKKKKDDDEQRQMSDEVIAALMSRLDRIESLLDMLSSILTTEDDFSEPADAADAAAVQAVDAPVSRTTEQQDPYGIINLACRYAGRNQEQTT